MNRSVRHRRAAVQRIFLAMMLMLGFVLQPVMAICGQLHETLAHVGENGTHVEGDAHDDVRGDTRGDTTATADEERRDPDTGFQHALSHHAHCCAQPQWLPPMALQALPPVVSGKHPPGADPDAAPDSGFDTPFRPPIVG